MSNYTYYIEWITNKRFTRRLKCSVKEGVGLCGIRQVRWTDSATPQGEKPLSLLVHLWDKPSPPSDVQSLANALTLYAWEMFGDGVMQIHLTKHTSEERSSRLNRAEKNLGCVWNPQIYSECPKALGTPSLNRWNHSAFKQQIPEQHFSEIWNVISKFKIHRTTNTYTSLYRNYDWLWQGCR